MTLDVVVWLVLAVLMFVVVPIAMVKTMIEHLRGRGSQRQGSGGISSGVGAALQELDRLMARPSVEHKVETEHPVLKREDDSGGGDGKRPSDRL